MSRVVQRTAARRDFIVHYAYLAENAGIETAQRFRQAVETTYAQLADMARVSGRLARFVKGDTKEFVSGESAASTHT